jgi:hypothetical protein
VRLWSKYTGKTAIIAIDITRQQHTKKLLDKNGKKCEIGKKNHIYNKNCM